MNNFEKYASLKKQINALEAEIKELQPILAEELLNRNLNELKDNSGLFRLQTKKNWAYSNAVLNKELDLKGLKKQEELNGIATVSETQYLVFKPL